MPKAASPKDLLGKPIRKRRPKYEISLERHELRNVPARAERIRWLSTIMPVSTGYLMPLECAKVFHEAKDCFVYGQNVATVVLASAFVEHWLSGILNARGSRKEAAKGLAAAVDYCRAKDVLPAVICDRVDALRKIRNPFVHLKAHDHEHALGPRMLKMRTHPETLLERDAKEALITMYAVAIHAKTQI